MVERSTKRCKVVTLDDLEVEAPFRLPPESNHEIKDGVVETLQVGSIGCGDGGRAIASSVAASANGTVPLAYAVHGRRPVKQFTRLQKLAKADIAPELMEVLKKQGRWDPDSSYVRVTGGNQAAESAWGTGKMNMKSRCVHRGKATMHSTAHAACGVWLCKNPGLTAFAAAWKAWFQEHLDKSRPSEMFLRSGWSGSGANAADKDAARIQAGGMLDAPRAKGQEDDKEGVEAGKAAARKRRRTKTKDDVEAGKEDAAES